MAKELLSLCAVKRITTRDGYVAGTGRAWVPFFGYWFANGLQITQDNTFANVAQDQSYTMTAPVKPNVFNKDCCVPGCGDGTGV